MKALPLAVAALVALLLAPATAVAGQASILDVLPSLTLGISPRPFALLGLIAALPPLDQGERDVYDDTLVDPAGIFVLMDLPEEVQADILLRRLGPVHGPHITDVPTPVLLAALTLSDEPVPTSALRSTRVEASIRHEDPVEQERDMRALLGDGPR